MALHIIMHSTIINEIQSNFDLIHSNKMFPHSNNEMTISYIDWSFEIKPNKRNAFFHARKVMEMNKNRREERERERKKSSSSTYHKSHKITIVELMYTEYRMARAPDRIHTD